MPAAPSLTSSGTTPHNVLQTNTTSSRPEVDEHEPHRGKAFSGSELHQRASGIADKDQNPDADDVVEIAPAIANAQSKFGVARSTPMTEIGPYHHHTSWPTNSTNTAPGVIPGDSPHL